MINFFNKKTLQKKINKLQYVIKNLKKKMSEKESEISHLMAWHKNQYTELKIKRQWVETLKKEKKELNFFKDQCYEEIIDGKKKLKRIKKIKVVQLFDFFELFYERLPEFLSELLCEVFSEIFSVEITYLSNKIEFFLNKPNNNKFYSGIFELYTKDNLRIIVSWRAIINNNIIDVIVTNYGENYHPFILIRLTKLDHGVIIEIDYIIGPLKPIS